MSRQMNPIGVGTLRVRLISLLLAILLPLPPLPAAQANKAPASNQAGEGTVPMNSNAASPDASKIAGLRFTCSDPDLVGRDVLVTHRNAEADRWGDITVAQPKIWQFERVNALLDGLLRDVEGISLGDLTQLDPSQQNGAALRFVQSALEVGVQYDQAAAVNAANTLGGYNALHASQLQQLDQYNTYMQTLTSERDKLAAQYSASSNEVNALEALSAAGTISEAQQKQLAEAQSRQTSTQTSLTSINSLISGAGAAPTLTPPPTLTGTSVQGPASGSPMSSSLSGFADVLKSLPQGVQNNLSTALQSPSYPATKRMDNFITLLYERLAREVSVLQDDLTRDPENIAFLMQFDVGLYPSRRAKDHVARVEFNLDCPGCKVYSLYPGQSSYNMANYSGASKRNSFWGNILTLIGLGVSASYRRQTDTLQGSLVQSVYTAGFQNGVLQEGNPKQNSHERINGNQAEQSFGWYYGAAPFEQEVSPGIRSTFALITVPRKLIERTEDMFGNTDACMPFHIDAGWANRNDPVAQDTYVSPVGRIAKLARTPAYVPVRRKLMLDPKPNGPTPVGDETSAQSDSSAGSERSSGLYDDSVLTMKTSVKLPAFSNDYPLIAKREHKMHVLEMEYNTVTEPTLDQVPSAQTVQTTVQSSMQSTNPATGQSTTQTATQTTGTTVAVSSPSSTLNGSPPSIPSNLDLLPCPKYKCASLVIKLDRPIDPNLVVTVRGQPLTRVRDWRGRATSVLPAAQSGTDLPASATASGSLALKQLELSRGLLESDQFAPNTWISLNSRELLLNVSVNVATDSEFPVIQLADPSGSVVIPHDLRRGFTELIINGFRFKSLTEHSIQQEISRQNLRETECPEPENECEAACLSHCQNRDCPTNCQLPYWREPDSPISAGPYSFSTFLPLFSPVPAPRKFFASVGETGEDLLIGFLPQHSPLEGDETRYSWREAQTQVVLEDRDLDLAWSLSCDVQGELLACRMPREEISRSYRNFLLACPDLRTCPSQSVSRLSLMQSLDLKMRPALSAEGNVREAQRLMFKDNLDLRQFLQAYVSTMQVWIWQADAEGKEVFSSLEPVRIGFLPLSDDYWTFTSFKPWGFGGAESDHVTIDECNYLPTEDENNIMVSLLGVGSWQQWLAKARSAVDSRMDWTPLTNGLANETDQVNTKCGRFDIPTAALANDPIVFSMEFPPHPTAAGSSRFHRATIAIPKARLGPNFRLGEMRVLTGPETNSDNILDTVGKIGSKDADSQGKPPGKQIKSKVWQIDIPVSNSACGDAIELPSQLVESRRSQDDDYTKIVWGWRNGTVPVSGCPEEPAEPKSTDHASAAWVAWKKADDDWKIANKNANDDWKAADKAERISLHLEVPRSAINNLPDRVDLVRTSDKVKWAVATLPNLRGLLLPSKLSVDPMGPAQFALLGKNAGAIDAVSLQGGDSSSRILVAAPGVDLAVVTLPTAAAAAKPAPDATSNPAGTTGSTQITIDTTKDNTGHLKMTTQNSSAPAKTTATNGSPSSQAKAPPPDSLPAGPYAVIPLIQVGSTSASANLPSLTSAAAKAQAALASATKKEKAAAAAAKNDPTNKSEQKADADAKNDLLAAQAAATKAETELKNGATPTPIYMPLRVTDEKGKPLTFTVPDAKKTSTITTPSATTASTTCALPCGVTQCTVACPQTVSPAPKSP